jgi:hypothetical protein
MSDIFHFKSIICQMQSATIISALQLQNGLSFFFSSFNIAMHMTYAMDTCIETNENRAFGTEVYSRYTWHM